MNCIRYKSRHKGNLKKKGFLKNEEMLTFSDNYKIVYEPSFQVLSMSSKSQNHHERTANESWQRPNTISTSSNISGTSLPILYAAVHGTVKKLASRQHRKDTRSDIKNFVCVNCGVWHTFSHQDVNNNNEAV